MGFLRVESTETKFLKFRPSRLRTQKRQKMGFGLCLSGSGNKEVSGLVPLATIPARKSGKFYEF